MKVSRRSALLGGACALVLSGAVVTVAHAGTPTITAMSIHTDLSEGGSQLTITGTGFTAATAIGFFNTTTLSTTSVTSACPVVGTGSNGCFTVNGDMSITATTPGHPASNVIDVTVTAGGLTSDPVANQPLTRSHSLRTHRSRLISQPTRVPRRAASPSHP